MKARIYFSILYGVIKVPLKIPIIMVMFVFAII